MTLVKTNLFLFGFFFGGGGFFFHRRVLNCSCMDMEPLRQITAVTKMFQYSITHTMDISRISGQELIEKMTLVLISNYPTTMWYMKFHMSFL